MMRTMTATEAARNFSRLLDLLEHGSEEIVITRNKHAIAKMIPGAPQMSALEAMADLFGILEDEEGAAWLEDIAKMDEDLKEGLVDPWQSS